MELKWGLLNKNRGARGMGRSGGRSFVQKERVGGYKTKLRSIGNWDLGFWDQTRKSEDLENLKVCDFSAL